MSDDPKHIALLLFSKDHPIHQSITLAFDELSPERLTSRLTVAERFVGHRDGRAHSGFVAFVLDTMMGATALGALDKLMPIATIKMSINHCGEVFAGDELVCSCRHDGVDCDVAYISAELRKAGDNALVARGIGAFMLGTRLTPLGLRS